MPNPFFFGGLVKHESYFVGRRNELRRIFAALEIAHTGQLQSYSVVGARRIGKSSLLYHVAQAHHRYLRHPAAYGFAYVDATDARCETQAGLLGYILDSLHIAHDQPLSLAAFTQALERLGEARVSPVVCLDEFERLLKHPDQFPDAFFDGLRALMSANRIAFVTASHTSLAALSREGKLTSPFFNVFTLLELGELSDAEADELTDRGFACDRLFSATERQWMRRAGGTHPMKLQIAGSLLYEAKASRRVDWRALERDYRAQIEFVFGKPPAHWRGWVARALETVRLLPHDIGRAILELLGRGDKASDRSQWLIGFAVIVLVLAVAFGWIGLDAIRDWFQVLTGTKK